MAFALQHLSKVLVKTGRYPEAEQAFRRANDILTDLARSEPGRPDYRRAQAEGHGGLAYLMRLTGAWPTPSRSIAGPSSSRQPWSERRPTNPRPSGGMPIPSPPTPPLSSASAAAMSRCGTTGKRSDSTIG